MPAPAVRRDGRAAQTARADVARLYLNLGRKDGASEREIREPARVARTRRVSVAEVDVMNTHTYLNVAPADAERIFAALTGKELGGRQLVCELGQAPPPLSAPALRADREPRR